MNIYKIKEYAVRVGVIVSIIIIGFCIYHKLFPPKEITAQCTNINIMLPNGNRVVGTVGVANGQVWIPQETLQKVLSTNLKWNKKDETLYIGKMPEAQIMSNIIQKPFNISTSTGLGSHFKRNKIMQMGSKEYTLGYSFTNVADAQFNLAKKYNMIQGIIGLEDYTSRQGGVVEIYIDDELVQSYKLNPKELAQKISLDVTGALKMSIVFKDFDYDARVNLANMYIQ